MQPIFFHEKDIPSGSAAYLIDWDKYVDDLIQGENQRRVDAGEAPMTPEEEAEYRAQMAPAGELQLWYDAARPAIGEMINGMAMVFGKDQYGEDDFKNIVSRLVFVVKDALKQDSLTMDCKTSAALTANIENGNGLTVTWSSSDEKVATVDRTGKVTATGKGEATITCTITDAAGNTATDNCKVTVKYTFWQWLIVILLFGWIWY